MKNLTLYFIDTYFNPSTTDSSENIVEKGEIAHNKQFLLFSQFFLLNQITEYSLVHIFQITSLLVAELEGPKSGISDKGLNLFCQQIEIWFGNYQKRYLLIGKGNYQSIFDAVMPLLNLKFAIKIKQCVGTNMPCFCSTPVTLCVIL